MKYLSKRGDLSAMDVTVTNVAFRQNMADATVHFQAKGSQGPGTGLDMKYVLERQGNEWVVQGRSGAHGTGSNPHGMGMNPHGGGAPGMQLPPGHPAIPQTQPQ